MPVRFVSDYTAILEGSSWTRDGAPTVLTYSFSDVSQEFTGLARSYESLAPSFQAFTAMQEATTRAALDAWAAVSGISFVEVDAGEGDLEFGNFDLPFQNLALGFYPTRDIRTTAPSDSPYGGDVLVDVDQMGIMSPWIVLHEIGHALGLEHPHEGNIQLQSAFDNAAYTVMSYNSSGATRLGVFDVQAIQSLYGSTAFVASQDGGVLSFLFDEVALETRQVWGIGASEILGTSLNDFIDAGDGSDRLAGFGGDDRLDGGSGNDRIFGGNGADTLIGGAGDDDLVGGNSSTFSENANDWASYEHSSSELLIELETYLPYSTSIRGTAVGDDIGEDTLFRLHNVLGGRGSDQIAGSRLANQLDGYFGDDTLEGMGGNDTLIGGGGNDLANGGADDDQLEGSAGFDTLHGDHGDDTLMGGLHADSLFGGDGADSLDGGDGFDRLHGDAGNDTLMAGASADRAFGGDGDDLIDGGRNIGISVDGLFGEAGNDTIFGGVGYDLLDGGDGDDLLDGGHQADNLIGGAGADTMMGGLGLDRLFGGDDNDIGHGGVGRDGMFGERGDDTLYGEDGDDRFFGGQGADLIFGGADSDTVYAGAGNDTIDGGTGNDLLQGNFNADTFVFADGHGQDTISDFAATNPREQIDLIGVSAIVNMFDLLSNHTSQAGTNVVIDTDDSNSILLQGVDLGDLTHSNFIF